MLSSHLLRADLHCHSTISDGSLSPDQVALRAAQRGVELWSLTDHDELGGQALARQTALACGMRYLSGVEISVTWAGQTVHIVGLGIDPDNAALLQGLKDTRSGRLQRAKAMGEKLDRLGMPGAFEGALPYADNPELISRTHFGRYLHAAYPDKFNSTQAVFDAYLKDDGAAYVPMQWARLDDAVGWILGAGGVAIIAHPGRYRYTQTQFDAFFVAFKEAGGKGIEVITGSHSPAQYSEYAKVARYYGFWASCGSDFHSPDESSHDLGSMPPLPADLTPVWSGLIELDAV